jgi:hypothetical protein
LNQQLSDLQVGCFESLGPLRKSSQRCPEINQGLHWLQIRLLEKIECSGREDEMAETAVHRLLEVQAEHVLEVGPIQVCVNPEHLPKDGLADFHEILREPAPFTNPVRPSLGNRGGEGGIFGVRDTTSIGGEDGRVVYLAGDIPLDQSQILVSCNLDRLQPRVQPSERVVTWQRSAIKYS